MIYTYVDRRTMQQGVEEYNQNCYWAPSCSQPLVQGIGQRLGGRTYGKKIVHG